MAVCLKKGNFAADNTITMKATEQTNQQIERFLKKIAQKYPSCPEPSVLTDIHFRVSQDSGELLAYDDDDEEITRCVVEQWIDNKDENFYDEVIYLADDDTIIIGGDLMEGLEKDLDSFLDNLLKK